MDGMNAGISEIAPFVRSVARQKFSPRVRILGKRVVALDVSLSGRIKPFYLLRNIFFVFTQPRHNRFRIY